MALDYEKIKVEMDFWREGLAPLPQSYIDYHEQLAQAEVETLKAAGYTIHNAYMASDGWGDGMRVLWLIAEKQNELMKLHWKDSHSKGSWFRQAKSGGSSPLFITIS